MKDILYDEIIPVIVVLLSIVIIVGFGIGLYEYFNPKESEPCKINITEIIPENESEISEV